jgi:hypothetical protein
VGHLRILAGAELVIGIPRLLRRLNLPQVAIGDSAPGKPESPLTKERGEEHEIPHMDANNDSVSIRRAGHASLDGSASQPITESPPAPSVQAG